MLEGLVAWVLNNYLGKYVGNLNTDQLSIALLSGKVELENLPLKKDALRHLGLPIQIKSGFIGKIKLQVPVRQIRSAPWVIVIEQLCVVASPLSFDEWDAQAEERALQELKLSSLDSLEARWRLEMEAKDSTTYYASSYSSWLNFGTGIISDIVENLQLKIEDVHIRYEDTVSIPCKSIAFGITMESLSAQTCDSNWLPGFSSWTKGDESFKLVEMQKFAMYWMTLEDKELYADMNLTDLVFTMFSEKNYNYILAPVSAKAYLRRNRSEQPLRSLDTPRIVCDLMLEEVPLTLVDWQYDQMVKCLKGLERIGELRGYRRYKPPCTVKDDPRAWWLYAISCFYPGGKQPAICRPRLTMQLLHLKAAQNVQYVNIYQKILTIANIVLTTEEKKLKDTVETERSFDELKILREVAMRSVPSSAQSSGEANSAGRSMLFAWFPQWIGWYSSSANTGIAPETKQLEGEILKVLSEAVENDTLLKRDSVFGHFKFSLKRGCLNLCTVQDSNKSSPMLELEFKDLSLIILSKPRTSSHLIELSLGSLYLKDKITLNTVFPILIGPPGFERGVFSRGTNQRSSVPSKLDEKNEHLFYMAYEKKPLNSSCDFRLCIRSKCLDIVYQPNAVRWLMEFVCLPHQKEMTQSRIEAMKTRTKKELIKNWEQMLDGRIVARTTWQLEFDISAPQIIFVEKFDDQNSSMAVIDFGRFQLHNNAENVEVKTAQFVTKDSEENEMFVTPFSTPPASNASHSGITTPLNYERDIPINEKSFHHKIYDRYSVEMTDLQILIGKIKDNWRHAHNKGTSTLHVLDRFNISLQVERRIIHTTDPHYPSLTLNANLPKLIAHLNENKITSARTLMNIITSTGLPSPFVQENPVEIISDTGQDDDPSLSFDTSLEMSRLIMLQFTIDNLSLEIQSRGRSVAELQVSGVKTSFMKRVKHLSATLTVHSLLLVDALQTFGPDFELLVASHKHVGMDSMSGSLRDSEPTSPISPASPEPAATRATSPISLSQTLTSLAIPSFGTKHPIIVDTEALITIEIAIVEGIEPLQLANIQFNNLDIIANQETIVELMGFIRRVFPKKQRVSTVTLQTSQPSSDVRESKESLLEENALRGSTKLTFDFHRLNVLILRGVVKDGLVYGKKICTATMRDATIQATVEDKIEIEGSLGGLQVLDLTPEGYLHQRIVSVGRDPLFETSHPLYAMSAIPLNEDERTAFSFKVTRSLNMSNKEAADVMIRMASLWYTHAPHLIIELESCATEFKQYLANVAHSIRTAATDVALGLVHARTEALAQSLYMNARLSSSIYGSSLSFGESGSPRKRKRSTSVECSTGYTSAKETMPQTPYSPMDEEMFSIDLNLDIELDSPVVVLPRASNSAQVFVAHLGRINVCNKYDDNPIEDNIHLEHVDSRTEFYYIEVRDMNLYSLDTSNRRAPGPMMNKPEVLYSCKTAAKAILHDTVLQLEIQREIINTITLDDYDLFSDFKDFKKSRETIENISVSGSVVNDLKVSLSRGQYEQLLDTIQWLTSVTSSNMEHETVQESNGLSDIIEEDMGVTTLNLDPHVRAKLFTKVKELPKKSTDKHVSVHILFELPIFTIELRGDSPTGERGLVDISFRDFLFNFEKFHRYETNMQVSLRSIYMEDLLQPIGSKQRAMVISSSNSDAPHLTTNCVSCSCPDITYHPRYSYSIYSSLPDHLETGRVFGLKTTKDKEKTEAVYPITPPPSPLKEKPKSESNLVLVSTLFVDSSAPDFETTYNGIQRSTSVDFNCLDLVISVESWVVLIDFFSAAPTSAMSEDLPTTTKTQINGNDITSSKETSKTDISVRSLTVVLVRPDIEVAKANISNIKVSVTADGTSKQVDGNLGSMSLYDLTLHGQLYRERFLTEGKQALQFNYTRSNLKHSNDCDAKLVLEMSSIMYVHTKRFVAELQAFFNHFTQLQTVMKSIRAATSGQQFTDEPMKLKLILKAVSPMIILPVSSKSNDLLVADLGQLTVSNTFILMDDDGNRENFDNQTEYECLLDVMLIELENMDLYTGIKQDDMKSKSSERCNERIVKTGYSLLKEKFQMRVQVERNLSNNVCHLVPDMMIYGQLSTLEACLDMFQYRLIRGFLAFNLGEDTERILPSVNPPPTNADPITRQVWTLLSFKLDLQNVTVYLQECSDGPPLTCINFIKSRLTVETFSNLSQDIDLISQEILIKDTRFDRIQLNERSNVFCNILEPIASDNSDQVQVEIHSRKRQDRFKFTILLNNMRLMAIFDWWDNLKVFIFQEIEQNISSPEHKRDKSSTSNENVNFEVKLNITDSEIVLVENVAQKDSNAVILKSTTVITYKPTNSEKPLSCSLNNCEMFSCVLGMEDETALSIIDPITLNMDINRENILDIQLQFMTVRLSYHDVGMFLRMLKSLPKQMFTKNEPQIRRSPTIQNQITKLAALGFSNEDCMKALDICEQKLDDAALWLTHNAVAEHKSVNHPFLNITAIEIKANCISVCIIDDCGDSDVPLMELSFSRFNLHQDLYHSHELIFPKGSIECNFASDYYNRVLSGWEPFVEPWKCQVVCERNFTESKSGWNVAINSQETLNINITSTLIDLYQLVKENWTKDSYEAMYASNYRRRSPFVPFALKNETGSHLYFTTLISEINKLKSVTDYNNVTSWNMVAHGETVPFSFRTRDKLRHQDSHKMRMHQLGVKVEGWQAITPVTVDRVGIFFRNAPMNIYNHNQAELPPARIVFDISLEGTARKLITVRSSLVIVNKLLQTMELKLDNQFSVDSSQSNTKTFTLLHGETLHVPLAYAYSLIHARPYAVPYSFCIPVLSWYRASSEPTYEMHSCYPHKGSNFRFCVQMIRETNPAEKSSKNDQPAHRIFLLPIVKLTNLLPVDLNYTISGERGRISAGMDALITSINLEELVQLEVNFENFKSHGKLVVPSSTNQEFTCHIRLEDEKMRKLFLTALISPNRGAKLKITISAPFWIVNKTGIPLVFRQSGTFNESAGQFREHEVARMKSPLLFSFPDHEASTSINARIGTAYVPDGSPQWCSSFHAHKGVQVRKLYVTMRDGGPNRVFIVGIEVRTGRGKHRSTNIITIAPRYQLYNQSSFNLQFTQADLTKSNDTDQRYTTQKAAPNSNLPFHWPRLDRPQLMCVLIDDVADCCWSGGFWIDHINSMHINVRDSNGRMYFLRLEIILQGATFFVIFTDADTMPPPIRIDNFSEVAVGFAQNCCKHTVHSTARAHSSVPYAWDQPTKKNCLTVIVPGGVSETYDMNTLGNAAGLTYENFIYIALIATFKNGQNVRDTLDDENQELVLDVVKGNYVVLARKRYGQRSQLWRMTSEGRLQHEGSSPPSHPNQPRRTDNILVLDIENTAPQPNIYSRLVLRRIDPRRKSTQTWRFTEEGRLCCAHYNMCVQAQDGFFGMKSGGPRGQWRQWNSVVLGLPQPVCYKVTDRGVPIEQAIGRQKLRPGSGVLTVKILMDGPTRVLSIKDMHESRMYATPDERDWGNIAMKQRPNLLPYDDEDEDGDNDGSSDKGKLKLVLHLNGVGLSLICRKTPEELLYAYFSNVVAEVIMGSRSKRFCLSVGNVQIDNQLLDTTVPVVLHVTPPGRNSDETSSKLPAIDFNAEILKKANINAVIFKYFILRLTKITIIIEEKLLLKLYDFVGFHSKEEQLINRDENDYEIQKMLTEVSTVLAKRYYFSIIKLIPDEIRLSVKTASKLPPHLQKIKRKLGLTLIKFENAVLDLKPFDRSHPFETGQVLINSIIKHFRDVLMWHAGIILGSVDFLGNPLGFVNDVSEGVSNMFSLDFGGVVRNVTHGISNSAVKVTESISDGLGRAVHDDHHEEVRQKIRQVDSGRSTDHIVAGFKGLGFGVVGGVFGIFKQTYEGVATDGIPGAFSGLGRGLVGAVTKPVVGVLDFASEAARAVRDSSKSKITPERARLPRCVYGPGGLLPRYSRKSSLGQQYLYIINDKNYKEQLVAYEVLGNAPEDLQCIVSNMRIRIVANTGTSDLTPIINCHLSDLESCEVICDKDGPEIRYYIEITMHVSGTSAALVNPDPIKKPRVRCKTSELAKTVSQQINYAKRIYFEKLYTLSNDTINEKD